MEIEERLDKHLTKDPIIPDSAYVAESAVLIGDVVLGDNVSIWPTTVLRGDIETIKIGESSNLQDGCIVHLADDLPAIIGDFVTVGHGAVVHACNVGDECLIGMRATIMDGADIGAQSIVGAHALVTKDFKAPPGSLILGSPAKIVKELSPEVRNSIKKWALKYVKVAHAHKLKEKKIS